jgi:hypothetical protein
MVAPLVILLMQQVWRIHRIVCFECMYRWPAQGGWLCFGRVLVLSAHAVGCSVGVGQTHLPYQWAYWTVAVIDAFITLLERAHWKETLTGYYGNVAAAVGVCQKRGMWTIVICPGRCGTFKCGCGERIDAGLALARLA